MLFFLLAHAFSLFLDLFWLSHRADHDKDLEILLLRQQLRILQRKQPRAPRISRWEKLTLLAWIIHEGSRNTGAHGMVELSDDYP